MAKDIEDIIDKGAAKEPKPEPKVEAPPKDGVKTPEAKDPPDAKKETAPEQTPPEDGGVSDSGDPDPVRQNAGLKAAATAERKKRQEADARAEAAEKRAAEREDWFRQQSENWNRQFQQLAPKEPEAPKPSLFENPEDWEKQVVGGAVQTFEQKLQRQHFQVSEMVARKFYKEEYGEAETWAKTQVSSNPAHPLRHALANSEDPGETLVQEFRKSKLLADMSDPIAYRKKVFEEMLSDPEQRKLVLDRLGAEPLKQAQPNQPPAPSALPSNLAGARSVTGGKPSAWTGPTPLGQLVGKGGDKKRA